jgi:23S rRNA (cytosine1962-C5)-methyltransferase
LVNVEGDQLPGVTVDCYADYAVLSVSSAEAFERRMHIAELLVALGARGVYLKCRKRADLRQIDARELAPPTPIAGAAAPDAIVVSEADGRFYVALGQGLSTGLFVDQRDNRARVRALSKSKRVLNLFSYTSSFSVAAALGGARETLSVDLSARALGLARKNFELNQIRGNHRFLKADALAWLERAERRQERFDIVVLDPPSFATIGKSLTFSVARGYVELAERALGVLAADGVLLAVTNHRKTSQRDLRRMLRAATEKAGRRLKTLKDLPAQLDCLGSEPSKSVLVTVV